MADIVDLFAHPDFNARQFLRFSPLIRAFIRDNRLYIDLEADPGCPVEWYDCVQCDLSDLPNHCLATARLEGMVEDPDTPRRWLFRTQPLEPVPTFVDNCSRRVVVTLHIGDALRRLTLAQPSAASVTAP